MAIKETPVTEFQIIYKQGDQGQLGDGNNPGLIATIRDGHLCDFRTLDFPQVAEEHNDALKWQFVQEAMKSDWQGWTEFIEAINGRLNISTSSPRLK